MWPQISPACSRAASTVRFEASDASTNGSRISKYALSRVRSGFPTEIRLPLVDASDASKRAVDAALEHAGLI